MNKFCLFCGHDVILHCRLGNNIVCTDDSECRCSYPAGKKHIKSWPLDLNGNPIPRKDVHAIWNRMDWSYHNQKKMYKKIRDTVFNILGGKICVRCGFSDERCLQIDHIYGGGNDEQKKFKNSYKMWRYYTVNPEQAKNNLQVLCANCNWIKRSENEEHSSIGWKIHT